MTTTPNTALMTPALANLDGYDTATVMAALGLDTEFQSAAKRPEPEPARRILSWHKGLLATKLATGKTIANYGGWAIEVPSPGEEGELSEDDELLVACLETLYAKTYDDDSKYAQPIIIKHKGDEDSGGKPRPVQYAAFSRASLYVVCEGIPSNSEMRLSVENRWGVAYAWPERGKSSMQFIVFIKELVDVGYTEPFLCSFSGPITGDVLNVLRTQHRLLTTVDAIRQQRTPAAPLLPYYAYALPLRVSNEPRRVGKGDKAQDIYYPVSMVPGKLDVRYLVEMQCDIAALLEENDRVPQTVRWSIKASQEMLARAEASLGSALDNDIEGSTPDPF